jgi:predicted HicB family RNase H-like nuclease
MARRSARSKHEVVGRSGGKDVTEEDIDRMVREAEAGYDVEAILRRRGRPAMGSGPAAVVPVRCDPELRAALEARAKQDGSSISEVIRRALRRYLGVGD